MTQELISEQRLRTQDIINSETQGLLAIVGPCANHKSRQIINEGRRLSSLDDDNLVTIHRQPFWKPRTPVASGPKPWEGLEDTNPEAALSRVHWAARRGVSVGAEIGKPEHIDRYSELMTFAWIGARSLENAELLDHVGSKLPVGLPLGVKNDLSGNIDEVLKKIDQINERKSDGFSDDSSAILIFRGGSDFDTPTAWKEQFKRVHARTAGRFIVDTAHGGEMAHDPKHEFKKTIDGQIACLESVLELADEGFLPRGIMIEASDYAHPDAAKRTDPNMPFDTALQGVVALSNIVNKDVG